MSGKTCLILANGDLGDAAAIRARLAGLDPDVVLAADGGTRHAATLGLSLTTVIGDLDSLGGDPGAPTLPHPSDKDETDLELALLHAVRLNADRVVLLGAVGGRLDMTIANALLLLHPALVGRRVEIWNGDETSFVLWPPGGSVEGQAGDRVSLIPLGGPAEGVSTEGLTFPLQGETVSPGPGRGVSNRMTEAEATIRVRSGAILVVHFPHRAPRGIR